jgi:hypothetical protein
MTKMTGLTFYLSTLLVVSSCSESTDTEKRTGGSGGNPYSGVGSESTPSDISGAWLTRCDLESFGAAVNDENDTIYCRTNDEAGKKSPREISFVDSALKAIKDVFKEDLPEASIYTVKYKFPTQTTKSYNDLLSPNKTFNVNYQIFDKAKFEWSATTASLTVADLDALIAVYGSKLDDLDQIFCDSSGKLKAEFDVSQGFKLTRSTDLKIGDNSCFIPTSILPNFKTLDGVFAKPSPGEKMSNGSLTLAESKCKVAVLFDKASPTNVRFAVLDKDAIAPEYTSPKHMTPARLQSAAYAGHCGFPSGIQPLSTATP